MWLWLILGALVIWNIFLTLFVIWLSGEELYGISCRVEGLKESTDELWDEVVLLRKLTDKRHKDKLELDKRLKAVEKYINEQQRFTPKATSNKPIDQDDVFIERVI